MQNIETVRFQEGVGRSPRYIMVLYPNAILSSGTRILEAIASLTHWPYNGETDLRNLDYSQSNT